MNIRFCGIAAALLLRCHAFASAAQAGSDAGYGNKEVTVEEAWQMAKSNHLPLLLKDKDVEIATASLKQERLWENPEVSISHNVNNPVTHRYFEINRDGETDIQLSQRIYIGGQRSERIRKAASELHRAEYERSDAERLLRRELCGTMVQLASARQKMAVVEKEIASAGKILKAYEEQAGKGNVASVEVVRIRSQHVQLLQEKASLATDIMELEQQLQLITGGEESRGFAQSRLMPKIDYEASTAILADANKEAILDRLAYRADLLADKQDVVTAEHDVKLQKANSLPELSLTGEWDKNGNIGHNYFAIGVSVTLPIFNRNQGGRKAAAAALEAKRMSQEWNRREAVAEVNRLWSKLSISHQMAQEAAKHLAAENEQMMTQIENQYMKRNISLLELLDYYRAYKDNHYLVIESRMNVLQAMVELDMDIK